MEGIGSAVAAPPQVPTDGGASASHSSERATSSNVNGFGGSFRFFGFYTKTKVNHAAIPLQGSEFVRDQRPLSAYFEDHAI